MFYFQNHRTAVCNVRFDANRNGAAFHQCIAVFFYFAVYFPINQIIFLLQFVLFDKSGVDRGRSLARATNVNWATHLLEKLGCSSAMPTATGTHCPCI
jgi:hypothetical protein